jgi:hypothetical protein
MSAFAVSIANIRTTQSIELQYNPPAGFREKVAPQFQALEVLGYSHQPQQYRFTSSLRIEGLDFRFDARSGKNGYTKEKVLEARRFFLSLQYAPQGQDVVSGSVDECIFVWPNFYSLRGFFVLDEGEYRSAARDGSPERFSMRMAFAATFAKRITSDDVFAYGTELAR